MQEIIKALEKVYADSRNQVAVIDRDAIVVWCNDIPLNPLEVLRPGMDLSKVAQSIFWSETKVRLKCGKQVQMMVRINEQGFYLYIEPFIKNEEYVCSLVHLIHEKALLDLSTAIVIHDLKHPVKMIKSMAEKMEGEDAETIRYYCNSAMGMISELEIVSAGRENERKVEDIDVTEFIGRLFKKCEKVLENKIQMDVRVTDKTLTCHAVAKELENAVTNLIVNARNHCKSFIKLELYEKDGHAVIAVENDGDKVDESIRDNIYEPCVKANSSGSGLGLYTVKTVADRIGGKIALVSGENTRFELSIPLAVAALVKSSGERPTINADYIKYVLERSNG